tara:strand:- start:564 stop:1235 length:672 start_codon:yes stop_codon:yes gene_type:complete
MHQRKSKIIILYLFLLIFVGSINNITLDNFKINEVERIQISGLNAKDSKILLNNLEYLKLQNFFSLNKSKINNTINSNTLIESYKIFKIYPSTLDVKVKETIFLANINIGSDLFFVGSNGKLSKTNSSDKELPFIFGKPNIGEFLKFKKIIDNSNISYKNIKSLYHFQSKRWDIELKNNILIKLPKKNIKQSLKNAYQFLNDSSFGTIKIIDARIDNKIIING